MNTPITMYVAPKYLHPDLRLQHMKKYHTTSFKDVYFLTLDYFFEQYETSPKINNIVQLIEMHHVLSSFEAVVFRDVLLTVSFLKELQHIMNLLIANEVDIEDFPQDTSSRKELRDILLLLRSTHVFSADYEVQCINHMLSHDDFSHVCLVHFVPANKKQMAMLKGLQQRGAIIYDNHLSSFKHSYHYALNIRQEVEACAQNIIDLLQKNVPLSDIAILVSDIDTYASFVKHVFSRYQLPFYMLDQTEDTAMIRYFHDLFSYYARPGVETLLQLASHPVFEIENIQELKQYVSLFALTFDDLSFPFNRSASFNDKINAFTRSNITQLENAASNAQTALLDLLDQFDCSSTSSLLISSYQVLVRKQILLSAADIAYANSVRSSFQPLLEALDDVSKEVACQIVFDVLSTIQVESVRLTSSIVISDITRPFLPANYGFALGLHQATYPNFRPLNGIFDESIAAVLSDYEPLSIRYQRHIQAQHLNLHFAHQTVLSYPQGNFEGKVYESSLDLEMQFALGKSTPWPFLENECYEVVEHSLDSQLARDLFVVNNELVGSISRFEGYVKCPYSFFLKYGLKLEEPVRFSLEDAEIGLILHGFFETAVDMHKKSYVNLDANTIDVYVMHEIAPYQALFRQQPRLFEMIREQLTYVIGYNLSQLREIEENTAFAPVHTEAVFDEIIAHVDDVSIRLKGIIDRIDEAAHGFRVLDYKSSSRSLSLRDFLAGLSLQLVTYSYIYAQKTSKKPFGCYYVNLSQPSLTHIPYHIDRRKKEVHYLDEETFIDEKSEPLRLRGMTFVESEEELTLLDHSFQSIVGLSYRKSGKNPGPAIRNPIRFPELSEDIVSMYEELGHRILAGNIALSPVEGACTYCPYKVVCHFHGKNRKPAPVIMSNLSKGEDA